MGDAVKRKVASGCLVSVVVFVVLVVAIANDLGGVVIPVVLIGAAVAGVVRGTRKRKLREASAAQATAGAGVSGGVGTWDGGVVVTDSMVDAGEWDEGDLDEWDEGRTVAAPGGEAFEPWTVNGRDVEIEEEMVHRASFDAIFAGVTGYRVQGGAELRTRALLGVDGDRVTVWVKGQHVGELPPYAAREWADVVRSLDGQGLAPSVHARVWAVRDGAGFGARVTLYLGDSTQLLPVNPIPDGSVLIPSGRTIQVLGEHEHHDVLVPFVTHGQRTPVVVTLHDEGRQVEVRIDGQRVGTLSGQTSTNVRPVLALIAPRGRVATARGFVSGSPVAADVNLHLARSQDLDPAWLESLSDPVTRDVP